MPDLMGLEDLSHDAGYYAYCNGRKIPNWANEHYINGWFDAYDAKEKFGEFDSPLQAP